jgi:WhiB family transcriptional regulator, redox-sensing transcriptional regulator
MTVMIFRPGSADLWSPAETDLDWQARAACLTTDLDLMFPEPPGADGKKTYVSQVAAAKQVCGYCPVRRQCLAYALANDEMFGVWGGRTRRERLRIERLAAAQSDESLAA